MRDGAPATSSPLPSRPARDPSWYGQLPGPARWALTLGALLALAIASLFLLFALGLTAAVNAFLPPSRVGMRVAPAGPLVVGVPDALRVRVTNRRTEALAIRGLQIAPTLGERLSIDRIEPAPQDVETQPEILPRRPGERAANMRMVPVYRYDHSLKPGASFTLTIRVTPRQPGAFQTEITVHTTAGAITREVAGVIAPAAPTPGDTGGKADGQAVGAGSGH